MTAPNTKNDIEDIYPLAPVQQGMVYHTLLSPKSGVYSNQLSGAICGDLDVPAFKAAWQAAIDRQPILRTAFLWEGVDEPLQVVRRRVSLPYRHMDWRNLTRPQQDARMATLLALDRQRDFTLSEPPLMRLALIQASSDRHLFVWTHHHLLLDAWSLPVLLGEIFENYAILRGGHTIRRPPAYPYRDYVAWLRDQDPMRAETHWRSTLRGFSTPTPFGIGRAGKGDQGPATAEQQIQLSQADTDTLQSFCRRRQLTMNTVVQGAWGLLLSRYSGESDVVFGSTVSSRPASLAGVESMIGLCINTIPVRLKLSPDQPVVEWLRGVQEQQTASREFSHSSLADIQTWSDLPRGVPLFETIVIFENSPAGEASWNREGSIVIRDLHCSEQTNYPMSLVAGPGTGLSLRLMYDGARFDADQIGGVLDHLAQILRQIAAPREQCTGDIALLANAGHRKVTVDWNDTENPDCPSCCAQQLFEQQAARTPNRTAAIFGREQITYAELNARANRLAAWLRERGVRPGSLAGISIERSMELLIAVLGVLKAGGAYVPLDPLYPPDRIAFMAEDAKLSVFLTRDRVLEATAARCYSDANPVSLTGPEDRAYVIYTSGSTGRPKGVEISHRALVNFLHSMRRSPGMGPQDVLLAVTSLSFDIAGLELLLPLTTGGRVVIAEAADVVDGARLRSLFTRSRPTIMQATPVTWRMLLENGWPGDPRLKALCGGEPMPGELAKALQKKCASLWNMYGPTETTIWSTIERVDPGDGPVSIGRPIDNTQIYILDSCRQAAPPGVAGDLFIAGSGLAHGYLSRPDLTADRFVPDPFSSVPGRRMYTTGDLARYLPDGRIECLGRTDHQIKLRGFRIELVEIESVLDQHPAVLRSVVVAVDFGAANNGSDKRLVAYVVAGGDQPAPDAAVLRAYASAKLPEYMVPGMFVFLPELPLTPNGKVDRKALPNPGVAAPSQPDPQAGSRVPPQTPLEELIAGIWSQVLSVERPDKHASFFDLGGHSLHATQVISRVNRALQVNLPIRELFETLTVESLARRVAQARRGVGAGVRINRAPRTGQIPASFSQERMWWRARSEPEGSLHHTPLALCLAGDLNIAALHRSLDEIVRRHESLRTTLSVQEGRVVQTIHSHRPVDLKRVDFSFAPAPERDHLVLQYALCENRLPFDLSRGPLFRVKLLHLAEEQHVLLLLLHHVITDAWSTGVFLGELSTLYRAFARGEHSPLPELRVQYADFAIWQRRWLEGKETRRQLSYWKKQLAGSRYLTETKAGPGAAVPFTIPDDLVRDVSDLCRSEGVTLFMFLLATFQVLLHASSGEQEMIVGSPVANRNQPEIEGLIGFFANTLMLRAALADEQTFLELLEDVRETTLDAYAHQDVPFEHVVEAVLPGHDPTRPPFSIWFTLDQQQETQIDLAGLHVTLLSLQGDVEMVDLTLRLRHEGSAIRGLFQYKRNRFDELTVNTMASDFRTLLTSIVRRPEQRISALVREVRLAMGATR